MGEATPELRAVLATRRQLSEGLIAAQQQPPPPSSGGRAPTFFSDLARQRQGVATSVPVSARGGPPPKTLHLAPARKAWQPLHCCQSPGPPLQQRFQRSPPRRKEEHRLREEADALRGERELEALRAQAREAQAQLREAREALAAQERTACSGCRLRRAMLSQTTTPEELRQAIGGVEALLDEARRELGRKELCKRRAAFEALHAAMASGEDGELARAIEGAHAAGVDWEDVTKAEMQLFELRALTPEQRAAKARTQMEAEKKREAFQLAKKDLADGLAELLEGLDEATRWQDWRDYSGRTLHQLAQELRSSKVMDMLRVRFQLPVRTKVLTPALAGRFVEVQPEVRQLAQADALPSGGLDRDVVEGARKQAPTSSPATTATGACSGASSPNATSAQSCTGDFHLAQAKGMRAVVQDDIAALQEVLDTTPLHIWSQWENKAGKGTTLFRLGVRMVQWSDQDMLTLADERGSSNAYSLLAKALGLIQELKREVFEERESVWVFMPGDVQARRATVLEEVPEEADQILVEFWDGDDEPLKVNRCQVRKGAS